jgi:hypothetical protein
LKGVKWRCKTKEKNISQRKTQYYTYEEGYKFKRGDDGENMGSQKK